MVRIVNGPLTLDTQWTQPRLLRAVDAYVHDGFLPATVLERARRRERDDRLPAIVAGIKGADPLMTLQAISRGSKPCASEPRAEGQTGSRRQ